MLSVFGFYVGLEFLVGIVAELDDLSHTMQYYSINRYKKQLIVAL